MRMRAMILAAGIAAALLVGHLTHQASAQGVTGQAFPRLISFRLPAPDFDSGWIPFVFGGFQTLTHNLGGNVDKYFVDLQRRSIAGGMHTYGHCPAAVQGAFYSELGPNTVELHRTTDNHDPTYMSEELRLRIWITQ